MPSASHTPWNFNSSEAFFFVREMGTMGTTPSCFLFYIILLESTRNLIFLPAEKYVILIPRLPQTVGGQPFDNSEGVPSEYFTRGGDAMDVMDMMTLLGFAVTLFIAGYTIGKRK
jgi:hypothetical protein